MTADAIPAEHRNTASAVRALGERIAGLETGQSVMVGRLDQMSRQLSDVCADFKAATARIDNHETRITVQERAWSEQVRPALDRLHSLELKVAASAAIGGGAVVAIAELIRALAG